MSPDDTSTRILSLQKENARLRGEHALYIETSQKTVDTLTTERRKLRDRIIDLRKRLNEARDAACLYADTLGDLAKERNTLRKAAELARAAMECHDAPHPTAERCEHSFYTDVAVLSLALGDRPYDVSFESSPDFPATEKGLLAYMRFLTQGEPDLDETSLDELDPSE